MDTVDEVIESSCSNIPSKASKHRAWARDVLTSFVPVVLEASLIREESRYQPFSIAVIEDFPAESITVKVRKETPVLDGIVDSVGVELTRDRRSRDTS